MTDTGLMFVAAVDRALRAAGVPIDGVSIKRRNDKSTWRVDFKPEATDAHKAAAQAVLDAFDPDAPLPRIKDKVELLEERILALEAKVK